MYYIHIISEDLKQIRYTTAIIESEKKIKNERNS